MTGDRGSYGGARRGWITVAAVAIGCGSPPGGAAPTVDAAAVEPDAASAADAGIDGGGAVTCPTAAPTPCANGYGDGPWTPTVAAEEYETGGYDLGFGLDGTAAPRLVYYEATHRTMRHAAQTATSWRVEAVLARLRPWQDRLAATTDPCGGMHIAHRAGDTTRLVYVRNADGEWLRAPIPTLMPVTGEAAIAVDTTGAAHVAYAVNDDGHLEYATDAGGAWTAEPVPVRAHHWTELAIAVDPAGGVHIAFDADRGLGHAAKARGGTWTSELVNRVALQGEIAMVAEPSGRLDIAYGRDWTQLGGDFTGQVRLATRGATDTAWTVHPVFDGGNAAHKRESLSLAIDRAGSAHIAFTFVDMGEQGYPIKTGYVTNATGKWLATGVTPAGGCRPMRLALDANGRSYIACVLGARPIVYAQPCKP